ncbi:MAG: hypothetical protein R3330_10380 [Saprospiraceae bacterium]|nr:hypothetical protein [Saprospiraceae bacterium]
MDRYEKIGYSCLAIVAVIYVLVMLAGVIAAFPYGLVILILMLGFGVLLVKVIKERLANKEDDHYSRTVEK